MHLCPYRTALKTGFMEAQWKNENFTAMQFFSSNRFRVKLLSRNFCEKVVAVKFRIFHNVRGKVHKHGARSRQISSNCI